MTQTGENSFYILLAHHPQDSRIDIAEGDIVQTLPGKMGTGG